MARSLLFALVILVALPATVLQAGTSSKKKAKWTCPVQAGAILCQGNGGKGSHNEPHSFHAFDYEVEEGTPVVAARDGVVCEAVDHNTLGGRKAEYRDMANRVVLLHEDGTRSVYAHLKTGGTAVRVGERVMRGEIVGWSGSTGYSSGPHLHFAVVREDGVTLPIRFADFRRNRGVPERGDQHRAAPRPKLAQPQIDEVRRRLRALAVAQSQGWPEVGLFVLDGHRSRRADEKHPLNVAVATAEAACTHALERLAGRVIGTRDPDAELVVRLVRAEVAAEKTGAPRTLRTLLEKARRSLRREKATLARSLKAPVVRLLAAMVKECFEEEGAVQAYASLLRSGPEVARSLARARFDHLVEGTLATCGEDLTRLKADARRAGPEHEEALLHHAEETLGAHRARLQQAVRAGSERRTELQKALARMRDEQQEIASLLR